MISVRVVSESSQTTEGQRSTKLLADRSFEAGQVVGSFHDTATITSKPSYSSIQVSAEKHVELNCPFVYLNHSCSPLCFIDIDRMEVIALRDIPAGTELTFFYPSTEWEMAEPFKCWCKSAQCIGEIKGAKYLTAEQMGRYKLTGFIEKLYQQQ